LGHKLMMNVRMSRCGVQKLAGERAQPVLLF
jgi:hypothetical protein